MTGLFTQLTSMTAFYTPIFIQLPILRKLSIKMSIGREAPHIRLPVVKWEARQSVMVWLASIILMLIASYTQLLNLKLGLVLTEFTLALPPVMYVSLRRFGLRSLGLRGDGALKALLMGCSAAPLTWISGLAVHRLVASLAPPPSEYYEAFRGLVPTSIIDLAVWLFITGIIVGPCEELLFRGFVQQGFEAKYGRGRGLVLASVLFGVMHLDPWRSPSAIIIGLILGFLFQKTKYNLLTSIGAHAVNNCIGMTVAYLFA